MLYDIQKVERSPEGVPVIVTDMVTSDKRRVHDRVFELQQRRQHCRVVPQYGPLLTNDEIRALR